MDKDLAFVLAKLITLQEDANINIKIFYVVPDTMVPIFVVTIKQKYIFIVFL